MDYRIIHKALLQPEAYPDAPGEISFLETHISRLYFTADHVYKIKKPVNFGFLDFTTLDRRRFYCQEEISLNNRFCPNTYLRVVDIREKNGRIRIDGEGEVVEYAVLMKRLPRERMLDRLIDAGDPFLQGEMGRLARYLAEIESTARVCRDNERSNLETVQRNWRENFDQVEPYVGRTLERVAQEATRTYVDRFLSENTELLKEREEQGYVREGHGDLHAEHIVLTDPICIFDCIEFNRRFRIADVVADIAFLLMDLDFRGRRDLARRLLQEYVKASEPDPGFNRLLPFYKIYRAFVRGKVNSFLFGDESAEEAEREKAAHHARRYFNLVQGYLCPQVLILTCGLMGTGKSTIAQELADLLAADLWRSDVLRKDLVGLPPAQKREDPYGTGIYAPALTRRTYDQMLQHSRESLKAGQSVLADASFAKREDRDRFQEEARRLGIPCLLVHLHCPAETALERLDARRDRPDEASEGRRELYREQEKSFSPPESDENPLMIDTTDSLDYSVHLILGELLRRGGEPHEGS